MKKSILKIFSIAILLGALSPNATIAQNSAPWNEMDKIIKSITVPKFKNKDYIVTDYGAVGNGNTDCSEAIKKAIDACNKGGGGRVVIPPGKYCTGPVYIKSNVNLHLQKDAVLLFSTNPDDYLPLVQMRWEGVDVMNYSPLVYSFREKNIAITGEGTLDGQASKKAWWPWKGRKNFGWIEGTPNQTDEGNRQALFDMAERDVPVSERKFGNGHYLRPQFVQPYGCENVLIEGITIIRSPMWILHPVLCTNLTIKNVNVDSKGPNTDGCDPESCKNVLIKDCYFKTGDDCIALKSGRNRDGRRIGIPCENVVIQNVTTQGGHAGIGIGSEISGGVKNVFVDNCKINGPMWPIRFKTSSNRGGTTENVYIRNIEVDHARNEAIVFTMTYEDKGEYMPTIKNVVIENMTVEKGGKIGISMDAYAESPIENILFKNITIKEVQKARKIKNAKVAYENVVMNGEEIK